MKTKLIIALAFIGTFANAQIQNFNTPVRFKSVNESNVAQKVAAIAEDGTLQWINRDSIKGQEIDTSRFLVKDSTNTVTENFEITNGYSKFKLSNNYAIQAEIEGGPTIGLGSNDGYAVSYYMDNGSYYEAYYRGINGSTGEYIWGLRSPNTGISNMIMPVTGQNNRTLAVSVNNQFADDNGNIEVDIPEVDLSNVLKKDEDNTVTENFEINNGTSKFKISDDFAIKAEIEGVSDIRLGSDDGYAVSYYMNDGRAFEANTLGINGSSDEYEWVITSRGQGASYTYLPITSGETKTLAVSVNGEYADENGNIEINELPTPPATGCHTLQANNGVTSWIPCTE